MIDILLLGVNHYDPYGRLSVAKTLSEIKSEGLCIDSIAVEWDEANAKKVIGQRDSLFSNLKKEYPQNTDEQLRMFSDAIAFEVDSHTDSYPDLPIIWLDEGRSIASDMVKDYAVDRFKIYSSSAVVSNGILDVSATREKLINASDTKPCPSYRDECFVSKIQEAIESGCKCIACIVGLLHANTTASNMFGERLVRTGYHVVSYDLTMKEE